MHSFLVLTDSYLTLSLAWISFGVIHSLLASIWIKQKVSQLSPFIHRHYRVIYNLVAVLTLAAVMALSVQLTSERVLSRSVIWEFIGLMFATYGFLIMRVAMKSYGWREFLGLFPEEDAHSPAKQLKKGGLLRYVRHPIYTGVILLFLGVFFYLPTMINIVNLICVIAYILVGIYFEERKLTVMYGQDYEEYRRQVPMLWPSLK